MRSGAVGRRWGRGSLRPRWGRGRVWPPEDLPDWKSGRCPLAEEPPAQSVRELRRGGREGAYRTAQAPDSACGGTCSSAPR